MRIKRKYEITKEVRVLRYLRLKSGISIVDAGRRIGISSYAINHIERGRMKLPRRRLDQIIRSYGYTKQDFDALMKANEVPICKREECVFWVKNAPPEKLEIIYPVLQGILASGGMK